MVVKDYLCFERLPFVNGILEPFKEGECVKIEYPFKGSKKQFQIRDQSLVIDFDDFIKQRK